MTAWIRFRHSIEGVLVGELESVFEGEDSGAVYVFAKNCRDAETGKKASWERTGVALSAVIGVEKGPAP